MNSKWLRFTILLCAVALLGFIILAFMDETSKPAPPNVPLPPSSTPVVVEKPTVVLSPTPAPTPLKQEVVTGGMPLFFRVIWDSDGEPVPNASLSLALSKMRPFTAKGAVRLKAVSDARGIARFQLPMEEPEAKKCGTELIVSHPDARTHKGNEGYVATRTRYPDEVYPIRLEEDCSISGTVFWKPDGVNYVPAAGATVVAMEADAPGTIFGHPLNGTPETHTNVTDDEGKYKMRGLSPSPKQLFGRLEEHITLERPKPVMPERGSSTKPWDIYLEQGATISAMVSDSLTYEAIRDAAVTASYGKGCFSITEVTDSDGYCLLKGVPLGGISLEAAAEGYARETCDVKVGTSKETTIPFFLGPGGTIRLAVEYNRGQRPFRRIPDSPVLITGSRDFRITERTGDDGCVTIEGVPCGEELLIGPATEGWQGYTRVVVSADKVATAVLGCSRLGASHDFIRYMEHHTYEGIIVDEKGKPVPRAMVSSSGCCKRETVTDDQGRFSLPQVHVGVYPFSAEEPVSKQSAFAALDNLFRDSVRGAAKDLFFESSGFKEKNGTVSPYLISPAKVNVQAKGYKSEFGRFVALDAENKIILSQSVLFSICVKDKDTKEPITDYWLTMNPEGSIRVVSDDGVHTFSEGRSISYIRFSVSSIGYVDKRTIVAIRSGSSDILLEREQVLQAIVLDGKTMEPVSGVLVREADFRLPEIWTAYERLYKNRTYVSEYTTDENGRFTFSNTGNGRSLVFVASGYPVFSIGMGELVKLRDPETKQITILLSAPTASVSATYSLGPDRFDESQARLFLTYVGPQRRETQRDMKITSYQNGTWRWSSLYAGEYRVSGGIMGHSDNMRFTLKASESKTIRLGERNTCSVSGYLLNKDGGAIPQAKLAFSSVGGTYVGKNFFSAITGVDGAYSVRFVPPGEYDVDVVQGTQYKRREQGSCSVSGDCVIDFKIEEFSENKPPSSVEQ